MPQLRRLWREHCYDPNHIIVAQKLPDFAHGNEDSTVRRAKQQTQQKTASRGMIVGGKGVKWYTVGMV